VSGFDTIVVVDWSARSTPSPARETADAIWIGVADGTGTACHYRRTRHDAMTFLRALFEDALDNGNRVLAGFDFPFAYPRGFARAVTGTDNPLALWEALAARIEDAPDNANNRFAVAAALNRLFPGAGPFWGRPATTELPDLPRTKADYANPFGEKRGCERAKGAQPTWKLAGVGSVGSQALLGIPRLQALRTRFGEAVAIRPFEDRDAPITLVELFPSLIADTVAAFAEPDEIKDRAQVRVLAGALRELPAAQLDAMTREGDPVEGWILGLDHEENLNAAARRARAAPLTPPPLRNDCFAMPRGVDWVPVDLALARLRAALHPVTGTETLTTAQAAGRVLAEDTIARRSNPPRPNAAVDGYGFSAAATGEGPQFLPLVRGRAAAGQPFDGTVAQGHAIRILTGAILPKGVDTVVLQEDTTTDGKSIAFRGPLKRGANTRGAGEDVVQGSPALPAGQRLRAPDLALLSALGIATVTVRRRLRVGVLSTGDELVDDPARPALPHQIYDANRPMLLALAEGWGHVPVDLGHAGDDPGAVAARLEAGAARADVILTSGGASAGDEDHVSALLRARGNLVSWRIAIKPGRPLALALWNGVPVFGLPGNPVAAFVCALVFGRPALSLLAGAGWQRPAAFTVPAAFSKRKKPGRTEYLRARLTPDGAAEVFASEGSGRISGLSWADGLVELENDAAEITPGKPVQFLPYAAFGVV
jgi:molybdopterin molybdotransferase